jgi:hypothetical protein
MGDAPADYAELALVNRVEQFVAAHACPFLVSLAKLVRPRRAGTVSMPLVTGATRPIPVLPSLAEPASGRAVERETTGELKLSELQRWRRDTPGSTRPLVLPVRKIKTGFPSMITIGRTPNNDVVVEDGHISRFHAYFRALGERWEIADAGSRNGTFVGARRLVAKEESAPLSFGDKLVFAQLEFLFLDARSCWEWLHQLNPWE